MNTKQTLNNRGNNFSHAQKLLRGWKSFVLCLVLFYYQIFFVKKKKKKQIWNCLDKLIILYFWREPLLTRLSRIYLYTLIFICDHLQFFKQAYEYHHLKQISYYQNMIMIFCPFHVFPFYVFTLNYPHFMSDCFLVEQSVFEFTKLSCNIHSFCCIRYFFLSGFSFTNIHESQGCRGRGREFL